MALVPQNLGVPTGTVMWSAAPEPPVGWLLCDGREVSIADHPVLASYLGTTFGGDGELTFGLPNLVGRFIRSVGEAGRDRFTYQDPMNESHLHGMFPNVTHSHGITDPTHFHGNNGATHDHSVTANHSHNNTADHSHNDPPQFLRNHGWLPNSANCAREVCGPNLLSSECPPDPNDKFNTAKDPGQPGASALTGIKGVNSSVTNVTFDLAYTGLSLESAESNLTVLPAASDLTIEPVGEDLGPYPENLALLPIIRT